jgi:hypothetical protein
LPDDGHPNQLAFSRNGAIVSQTLETTIMTTDRLDPVPHRASTRGSARARGLSTDWALFAASIGKDEMNRLHAINHFNNVETVVAMMNGLSDTDVERYFQRVLDDAEPGAEQVVSNLVDAIKAARSARPSS